MVAEVAGRLQDGCRCLATFFLMTHRKLTSGDRSVTRFRKVLGYFHKTNSDKFNDCPSLFIINPKNKVCDIRNEAWSWLLHRS